MQNKSLLKTNKYLKNKKERHRLLLRTVISSTLIEGIKINKNFMHNKKVKMNIIRSEIETLMDLKIEPNETLESYSYRLFNILETKINLHAFSRLSADTQDWIGDSIARIRAGKGINILD